MKYFSLKIFQVIIYECATRSPSQVLLISTRSRQRLWWLVWRWYDACMMLDLSTLPLDPCLFWEFSRRPILFFIDLTHVVCTSGCTRSHGKGNGHGTISSRLQRIQRLKVLRNEASSSFSFSDELVTVPHCHLQLENDVRILNSSSPVGSLALYLPSHAIVAVSIGYV